VDAVADEFVHLFAQDANGLFSLAEKAFLPEDDRKGKKNYENGGDGHSAILGKTTLRATSFITRLSRVCTDSARIVFLPTSSLEST
jgi:hypothetical protein